jgi:hypothetical protein
LQGGHAVRLAFSTSGLTMKSIRANLTTHIIALSALGIAWMSPAFAAEIPDDHAQDALIRSTLARFNDANMTNDYSVFMANASQQLQTQVPLEKMAAAFEGFRKNHVFFDDVVAAKYASHEKAVIDKDGALVLVGVMNLDKGDLKYNLRFVQNDNVWKVLFINVDVSGKKQN